MKLDSGRFLDHRFLFIKDYPESPFIVGDILSAYEHEGRIYLHDKAKLEPKLFPDNFKELRWWEHRTIEQLSSIRYMKIVSGSSYYGVGDIVEVLDISYNNTSIVGGRANILFNLKGHYFIVSQLEPTTQEAHDKFWEKERSKVP
jgi:hypothetical protein